MVKGSVLIEIGEDKVSQNVGDAPPVPDEVKSIPTGAAMQSLVMAVLLVRYSCPYGNGSQYSGLGICF
jgi:hypothetical protein